MYWQATRQGFHVAMGTGGTWKPCLIGIVRCFRNGVQFNIGGFFIVFCWPLSWIRRGFPEQPSVEYQQHRKR